jgi:ATP-dependent protease ClpP protease subunit
MNRKRSAEFDQAEFDQNDVDKTMAVYGNEPYSDTIYMAGKNEIHFSDGVNVGTIIRLRKLIAGIVDDNKHLLVKYGNDGKPERDEKEFEITYVVDSPGGSVTSILVFVDYLEYLRNTFANIRFTSVLTGLVASAGTIMCVVADRRKMTRYAHAMIHELSGGGGRTNYSRIMSHGEFVTKLHTCLNKIYQESRGIDPSDGEQMKLLEDMLIRETWMNAEEYMSHGFVHEIISIPKKRNIEIESMRKK